MPVGIGLYAADLLHHRGKALAARRGDDIKVRQGGRAVYGNIEEPRSRRVEVQLGKMQVDGVRAARGEAGDGVGGNALARGLVDRGRGCVGQACRDGDGVPGRVNAAAGVIGICGEAAHRRRAARVNGYRTGGGVGGGRGQRQVKPVYLGCVGTSLKELDDELAVIICNRRRGFHHSLVFSAGCGEDVEVVEVGLSVHSDIEDTLIGCGEVGLREVQAQAIGGVRL